METWLEGPPLLPPGIYAGIGSRETPQDILSVMTLIAQRLASLGWVLRSGAAPGADSAFEAGAGLMEIYIPWVGFSGRQCNDTTIAIPKNNYDAIESIARAHHPAWGRLSFGARKLHTRNVMQILGQDLSTLSDFVLCWTPQGKGSGGTGQALRIASAYGIPIYDLGKENIYKAVSEWLYTGE